MLRVSTANLYRSGERNILERQADLLKAQTQLASGKRINAPADDPLGAADANAIRSSLSQFAQFKDNQGHARYLLNLAESAIAGVAQTVQDVQTRLVEAGNSGLGDPERRILAADLEGQLARLVG
ncbi:MAG: flagellar hook-associated protein 3, partial [Phycisphaerae bacterium]